MTIKPNGGDSKETDGWNESTEALLKGRQVGQ